MAVRFDTATDKISVTSSIADISAGLTLTGWVYVSVDTNANATFARLWAAGGATTSATFATDVDGLAGPAYFTGGGSVVATTGLAVGAWRKVAFTRSGTTGHVYVATVGGATEHVSGTVGGATGPTGLTLGGRSPTDDTESFNGRLAYVRVWTSQHSQAQVEAEWASTTPVVTSGLWADWPLATAADLTDHSGNGRDLTAGSTSVTTEDGPPLAGEVTGVLVANLGTLSASTTGTRVVTGVTLASLGGLVATTTGARTVVGTGVASLGQLVATIVVPGALPVERIHVAGREPRRAVSGREPRRVL